jgi:hypothetical protein
MQRALLVGINEYPNKEDGLAACLNDVNDFALFLVGKCGFEYDDVRLLTERRATRVEILKRLDWLVKGVKSGDRIVFLYSGHGNRLATRNDVEGKVDKYYECICPYDFDWEGKNNISDAELGELFSRIPEGAKLVWISDSCYSCGLSESEIVRDEAGKHLGKSIQQPQDIAWRAQTAIHKDLRPLKMSGAVEGSNVILISATKERQQAQERSFKKEIKVNGLLVSYLLEELNRENGLDASLKDVMVNVVRNVKEYGRTSKPIFDQEPVLYGRPELIEKAFLK